MTIVDFGVSFAAIDASFDSVLMNGAMRSPLETTVSIILRKKCAVFV